MHRFQLMHPFHSELNEHDSETPFCMARRRPALTFPWARAGTGAGAQDNGAYYYYNPEKGKTCAPAPARASTSTRSRTSVPANARTSTSTRLVTHASTTTRDRYAETLLDVHAYAQSAGLPYRHVQLVRGRGAGANSQHQHQRQHLRQQPRRLQPRRQRRRMHALSAFGKCQRSLPSPSRQPACLLNLLLLLLPTRHGATLNRSPVHSHAPVQLLVYCV